MSLFLGDEKSVIELDRKLMECDKKDNIFILTEEICFNTCGLPCLPINISKFENLKRMEITGSSSLIANCVDLPVSIEELILGVRGYRCIKGLEKLINLKKLTLRFDSFIGVMNRNGGDGIIAIPDLLCLQEIRFIKLDQNIHILGMIDFDSKLFEKIKYRFKSLRHERDGVLVQELGAPEYPKLTKNTIKNYPKSIKKIFTFLVWCFNQSIESDKTVTYRNYLKVDCMISILFQEILKNIDF